MEIETEGYSFPARLQGNRRNTMRSFVAACLVAAAVAVGAAAALDALQKSSSDAFAEGSVRL